MGSNLVKTATNEVVWGDWMMSAGDIFDIPVLHDAFQSLECDEMGRTWYTLEVQNNYGYGDVYKGNLGYIMDLDWTAQVFTSLELPSILFYYTLDEFDELISDNYNGYLWEYGKMDHYQIDISQSNTSDLKRIALVVW